MAAGLGYIEFSTGDILTAAVANGYLASQTVMVFADAAARTSAIASPQEGMISYLKDTNATEYYSGSAWAAVGGGGSSDSYTTIASGSLSASALNITSIPTTYKKLVLVFRNFVKSSAYDVNVRFNGVTSSNYAWLVSFVENSAFNTSKSSSSTVQVCNGPGFRASVPMDLVLEIEDYANTVADKVISFTSVGYDNTYNAKLVHNGAGMFASTSAITSIQTDSSFVSGDYILYGVK